ncbi:helix-turn-helix domain-containing protein [Vallitalea guaymasensis]|uniref:helix-turn-helix domain-containing protein n=1 Tax=Vallitalea guaymasensis TaxID=1185412 RepID=UPI000DE1B2A0|nr:helix-turn-helix domain-containing protein [Vallitalea guaymasensis]
MYTYQNNSKATYSIPEAAKILGISRSLCYNLASKGELPVLRLGERRMVIPRVALEKMLESTGMINETTTNEWSVIENE